METYFLEFNAPTIIECPHRASALEVRSPTENTSPIPVLGALLHMMKEKVNYLVRLGLLILMI